MNTQSYNNNDPQTSIDNSGYNWVMEAQEGKPYQSWLPSNLTDSNKITGCTNDDNGSDDDGFDNNGSDDNNSMQGDVTSVTPLPSDTPSALDDKQATLERTPSLTSTKAWHMATHKTSKGEQPLWCIAPPPETCQTDDITLAVSLDETKQHYTITTCFPARNGSDAVLWADPDNVSKALAQIEEILTKINPSVCFQVKTKALESDSSETRSVWHIKALNTLEGCSRNRVSVGLVDYPVRFGQASERSTIVPKAYYPNREEIINPQGRRHVLPTDQADRLYAHLPLDHPCYRPLKPKVAAQRSQLGHRDKKWGPMVE